MKAVLTRRQLVVGLVAAGGAAGLAGVFRLPPFGRRAGGSLGAVLSHAESARRIGTIYLGDHPEEADAARLRGRIAGSPSEAARLFEQLDPEELALWLRRRRQEDFREERTVVVGGWVLSRTEARLCALLSLG